jgi:hypothetical protein
MNRQAARRKVSTLMTIDHAANSTLRARVQDAPMGPTTLPVRAESRRVSVGSRAPFTA